MNPVIEKALKEGLLTDKQAKNLPEALVLGIIKSKRGGGKKKKAAPAKKKGQHKMPDGSMMEGKSHPKKSKKGKKGKK